MAENGGIDIKISKYTGKDKPFIPEEGKPIDFVLQEVVDEWKNLYPSPTDYSPVKNYIPGQLGCVLNVETSGLYPWESRVACIAMRDLQDPEAKAVIIYHEDEAILLQNFINYWREKKYTYVVGYNFAFDIRFLFATALRYRIPCPEFLNADITDLMQIMKQVKEEFVFGSNKAGTLDQWGIYLLNKKTPFTQMEVLDYFAQGDPDPIILYNKVKVDMTHEIFNLVKHTFATGGSLPEAPLFEGAPSEEVYKIGEKAIQCPNCLSITTIPETATELNCPICHTITKL